jgi:predicted ATPase
MLATIRSRITVKFAAMALLGALALAFSSCASNNKTAFISDPNDKKETALPWNEQQKWEREGEAAALNQQRR